MRRTCQCQDDLILTPLTQGFLKVRGFPGGSDGKESACHVEGPGSICGLERSLGEGNGYPFQCSCLENPMDRGAWRNSVPGVAKSQTRLTLTLSTKVTAVFFRNVCPILKWNREIRGLKGSGISLFFTLWQWIQRQRYSASAFVTAFWGCIQAPESPYVQI